LFVLYYLSFSLCPGIFELLHPIYAGAIVIRMLFQRKKGGAVRTLSGLLDDLGRLFLGFE
jgi:hypothetical protein